MTQSILTLKVRLSDGEHYAVCLQPTTQEAVSALSTYYLLIGNKLSALSKLLADAPVTIKFSSCCMEITGPSDLIETMQAALEGVR